MGNMSEFIHLHTHSHYSLLDGLSKVEDLVELAKKFKMPALAITDHGNLYGAIEFYTLAKKAGIKPIVGVEAYMTAGRREDRSAETNGGKRYYHLTLLVKNLKGYKNLIKLVTTANLEGYYYKPRMDKELLRQYHDGLICLSGCMASELGRALGAGDSQLAERVVQEYQEIFGAGNYWLEIMHHPKIEGQLAIKQATIELARRLKLPLVATQDCHYLEPNEARAHDVVVAIGTHTDNENNKRFSNQDEDFSFIDQATAKRHFFDTPEALAATSEIAARCSLELEFGRWVFPNFALPAGTTADQVMTQMTKAKLAAYGQANPAGRTEADARVTYELAVIIKKGYSSYFLVVADLIAD